MDRIYFGLSGLAVNGLKRLTRRDIYVREGRNGYTAITIARDNGF